ncbi:tumor susceptibility gene 101 protein-like [Protopterus annectens]|uniref:tumor susceptibility gene 101 protein-like n=1 Tax=Protopterus annectens TaxID=7888 RepID=UPI001CF9FC70|nr:tumor susceptibility gene 101 protein-like [Protopterus annectens]
MSAVPDAAVESTLAKCLYGNPAKILEDIAQVQAVYKNLHLFVDRFCYNAQVQKWLVNLSGTVPVMYKDHLYNLPLCIWLHTAHPWVYPKCFVKLPANMVILPGKHVDQSGDLVLNYLQNWKYPSSNLLGLVQEIISVFQQQPPVYAVMNPNYNVVHNPPSGGVNSSYGVYIPAASASSQTEVICENTKNINLCQNNLEVGVTVVGETDGQSSKKNLISLNCADDKNVHSYVKELLDNGIIFEAPVQPASTLPPSTQQPEIPVAQNIIVQKDHAAPVQDQNFHRAAIKCEAKETAEIFKVSLYSFKYILTVP